MKSLYLMIFALLATLPKANSQIIDKKLKISTLDVPPYVILKDLSNSEKAKGIAIDLLDSLAEALKFEYELIVTDRHGHNNETNPDVWTGSIGHLVDGKADMAVADLTVTAERLNVVDFSLPFRGTKLSLLFRKPLVESSLRGCLVFAPFTVELWVCIVFIFVAFVITLFLIGRISHLEWVRSEENKRQHNSFGLCESIWFASNSVLFKTTANTPKGLATRILSIFFFCCMLILTILYSANITSFLRSGYPWGDSRPVNSAEDFVSDNRYHYGVIEGGSTHSMINSRGGIFDKIHQKLKLFPDTKTILDAMDENPNLIAVVEGDFAESSTGRMCHLQRLELPMERGYHSFAFQHNSPLTNIFSKEILKLQRSGKIDMIYHKWLKMMSICDSGEVSSKNSPTGSAYVLSYRDVNEIFMIFGVGLIISFLTAIVEFVVRSILKARKCKKNASDVMKTSLKTMCICRNDYKEIVHEYEESINVNDL